jgi:hypothetical protein
MPVVPFHGILWRVILGQPDTGGDDAGQKVTLMIRVTRREAFYAVKKF